ncbi:DUF2530 domain-containing protein [Pedococcus sp. KACC 23699]|uniref:DUF2530 domain-containing protein n=1 Tax=Pedococcus sp. KACC 23699 TaxID=3149228 RepID=A0AAU7JXF2_9MICO
MTDSPRHPAGHPVGEPSGVPVAEPARVVAEPDELQPLALSSATVTLWGTIGWFVALGIILAVPSLHQGDRHWWPWTCVAAIVLGLLGFSYVRRGRGNATGAE